jgi:hypothetical protein
LNGLGRRERKDEGKPEPKYAAQQLQIIALQVCRAHSIPANDGDRLSRGRTIVIILKLVLNVIVSIAALIAGLLWSKSARVKVLHRPGLSAMSIGDTDIVETARAQSEWSARAAIAATVAAAAQAVVVFCRLPIGAVQSYGFIPHPVLPA